MRPFDSAADAWRLAELMTATGPEPVSEADVRAWMAGESPQTVFDAVIAEHGGAYAEAYRQPWHTPGEFTGRILVAPQRRRHGLGAALLDHITDFAVRHGATALAGRVREDDADGRRFADRHGFRVRRHTFESIVDTSSLDPNALQAPDPPDVTVMTLAELGDTDEHRREIWRIHEESFADEPSRTEAAQRTYEHFTSQLFETGWWRPENQFVALAGGSWAGVAVLRFRPQTNSFYTFYTGVDRPFRGRGIALGAETGDHPPRARRRCGVPDHQQRLGERADARGQPPLRLPAAARRPAGGPRNWLPPSAVGSRRNLIGNPLAPRSALCG